LSYFPEHEPPKQGSVKVLRSLEAIQEAPTAKQISGEAKEAAVHEEPVAAQAPEEAASSEYAGHAEAPEQHQNEKK